MNEHRRYYNYLMTILDALILVGAYMLAWYLRFRSPFFPQSAWSLARYIRSEEHTSELQSRE